MKNIQTPDHSRSSKPKDPSSSSSSSSSVSSKKPQKVAKKSLNGELASVAVAGDSLPEITTDSSQISKKSLNGAFTSEVSLPPITSISNSSQIAKKSLNDAFASAAEDSLSVITSDSCQANASISDLPALNPTITSEAVLVDWSSGRRPAQSVYELENLVRHVRSRKVLEEIIKVAVVEQLAAPPLISPPAEGIERVLNFKLGITLISFIVWCFVVFIAVPSDLGYPAGPSPT